MGSRPKFPVEKKWALGLQVLSYWLTCLGAAHCKCHTALFEEKKFCDTRVMSVPKRATEPSDFCPDLSRSCVHVQDSAQWKPHVGFQEAIFQWDKILHYLILSLFACLYLRQHHHVSRCTAHLMDPPCVPVK
ncbi:uncharacterized protein LOC130756880 [Actinidia eriantha]|uniref:uncharacterized protein LOC130756880 n=1 Tax=Actinidia eriantha TaxID=165200 RepID=UPI00258BFFE0|nr:uncharacterized protein LOC130756880 [Actinidia eriantha]